MKILEAIHNLLFASTSLTTELGKNISYARVPINVNWPCLHYFEVSNTSDRDMDYDRWTVQFSVWSQDKYQVVKVKNILLNLFNRMTKTTVAITGDDITINRADVIESGALPTDDKLLYGSFIRCTFKYRGKNIGGV